MNIAPIEPARLRAAHANGAFAYMVPGSSTVTPHLRLKTSPPHNHWAERSPALLQNSLLEAGPEDCPGSRPPQNIHRPSPAAPSRALRSPAPHSRGTTCGDPATLPSWSIAQLAASPPTAMSAASPPPPASDPSARPGDRVREPQTEAWRAASVNWLMDAKRNLPTSSAATRRLSSTASPPNFSQR